MSGTPTATKTVLTEFAGVSKILHLTVTLDAATNVITLTEADHGITTITGIMGMTITSGMAATFAHISASFSGLVITVKAYAANGTDDASTFGAITLTVVGY